jgi:hypothetical protein
MLWYPCTGFGARLYWNADFAKNKGEDGKTTFTANVFGSLGYYFDQFAYSLTTFKPDEPIDGENIFNGLIGVELSGDVGGKEKRAENKYNKFSGIAYLQFGRGDMNVPELDGTSKTGVVQTEQSMLNLGVGVAFNQSRRLTRRSRAPKPDGVTASALFEAKIAGDRPTSSNEETESLWRIRGYLGYAFLLNSGINVIPSASAGYSHNNATIDLLECPGCSAEGSFPGEATTSTFNAVFGVKVVNVSLTDTLKAEVGGGAGVIYVDRGEQSEAGFVGSANGKLTW